MITQLEREGFPVAVVCQTLAVSRAGVAFAPDGRSLVSGSQDGIIKLWDGEPGWEESPQLRTILQRGARNTLCLA